MKAIICTLFFSWAAVVVAQQPRVGSSQSLANSIGMSLTYIKAGDFVMGDAEGQHDERPHNVSLTRPFYIGTFEVTNSQWAAVMGSAPSLSKGPDHPVDSIDWDQAVAFCNQLSSLPAEKALGHRYRLPTEAEWEYACRAGTTTKWSFGDDETLFSDYGWFRGNSNGRSHPVGLKKPNRWGLYDMHGNIKEWCSDNYAPFTDASAIDPKGATDGAKVVRSGSWFTRGATACRSADRNAAGKKRRFPILGLRVVLDVSDVNTLAERSSIAGHASSSEDLQSVPSSSCSDSYSGFSQCRRCWHCCKKRRRCRLGKR